EIEIIVHFEIDAFSLLGGTVERLVLQEAWEVRRRRIGRLSGNQRERPRRQTAILRQGGRGDRRYADRLDSGGRIGDIRDRLVEVDPVIVDRRREVWHEGWRQHRAHCVGVAHFRNQRGVAGRESRQVGG